MKQRHRWAEINTTKTESSEAEPAAGNIFLHFYSRGRSVFDEISKRNKGPRIEESTLNTNKLCWMLKYMKFVHK